MTASQPNNEAIFHAARDNPDPDRRREYVREACGGDETRIAHVEALLAAADAPDSLLDRPAGSPAVATINQPTAEGPGTVIGPYKLLEQIGEGGFGVVFMAEQQQPVRRLVALKILKPGMDTRQVVARFEAERQALALMDHPHIAHVFDGGETASGRPYFVMELVKGTPIAQYCDEQRLKPRQRLELFVPVCQAIQHAHQKGIIHRDIKPSNVLVAPYDGQPVVKVIDFGVAKATGQRLTERTLFTGFGTVVGTLEYMSPEQAVLNNQDIDTRSDVYSLGVLLYELLTGTTPLERKRAQDAGLVEALRIIREEETPRPSARLSTLAELPRIAADRGLEPKKLSGLLRGELDWIVLKALEKDRARRYETASGFARDIERYLADEPVQACPPSAWYRGRKFARRHRTGLAVAGLILLFIALLGGGVAWALGDRAARQARAANELELALDRGELFLGQGKRPEALAAFDRAELLAGQVPADPARDARLAGLKERLAAEARDQQFSDRFEGIRLRVQSKVDVEQSAFIEEGAIPEIRNALYQYGIAIGITPPAQAAARIQGRPEPVRRNLVTALEECLGRAPMGDVQARQWLLAALAAADNDAWRVRARQALADRDWKTLEQWARDADGSKQPPNFLIAVATALPPQMNSTRLELLRRTQRAYPADLWANHWLAMELVNQGQPAEAVRYFTAALALRSDSPGTYLNRGAALGQAGEADAAIADLRQSLAFAPEYAVAHANLGIALRRKGLLDEAIAECREAIRLKQDFADAHTILGNALEAKGQLDEAIAAHREAIRLKTDDPLAHNQLANALLAKGLVDEAIAEYREAIRIKENFPLAHYNLGIALEGKGRLDEAIGRYREAIRLKKDYAEAHCNLGQALRQQGKFHEALEALRRGHQLGSRDPRWPYRSAEWVRWCERLVELDKQLPGFLEGKTQPASPAERVALAELCSLKRLHRAAARFYEEAFAAQPSLAEGLGTGHRYNAACAAALAGCGQGQDALLLDAEQRARLRRQALDWLRADLMARKQLLEKQPEQARAAVQRTLQHWQQDADFAGVRGDAVDKLPEAERQPWQQLWADVEQTLMRLNHKDTKEKGSN
jgi:serine/threonine protein kinase/Flp pilus assembly protein TadD